MKTNIAGMIKKTYIARNSVPHFNIGGRRICFTPTTMGDSYYTTTDEGLQAKIERHAWYKDKFVLESVVEIKDNKVDADEMITSDQKLHEVSFDTLSDAKNFLAEKYGAVRSNIRSIEQAVKVGETNGLKIIIGKH